MANGQKGKASKRKLDMREESGKLARQIGDRIRELRERMKDGDGRPITQPAFYDFIFDKPEYQQSTDNPNEPKPEESKQTEISNIEGGKDISLALLCLISDKCGVSLDYLIRGKEYQPGESTCPPEEKDASPAGDLVESQTESTPLSSDNDTIAFQAKTEESKKGKLPFFKVWDTVHCNSEFFNTTLNDVCKSLAALSYITDISITHENIKSCGRLKRGITLSIFPKEIISPVCSVHGGVRFNNWKVVEKNSCYDNEIEAFHLYDSRGILCIVFLREILKIESFGNSHEMEENGINNILNPIDSDLPLSFALNRPLTVNRFLSLRTNDPSFVVYEWLDDAFKFETEPYIDFMQRKNKQAQ